MKIEYSKLIVHGFFIEQSKAHISTRTEKPERVCKKECQ
jgi:hypothetical protein